MTESNKSIKQEESPYVIMQIMRGELNNQLPYNQYDIDIFDFHNNHCVMNISLNNFINVTITSNKNRWKIEVAEFEDVTIDANYLRKVANRYAKLNEIFEILTKHVHYNVLHNCYLLTK